MVARLSVKIIITFKVKVSVDTSQIILIRLPLDRYKYPFIRQNRLMIPDGENPGPIVRTFCTLPFRLDNF